MARDVMAVRLHLAQIRVLEVVEDTPGALVVEVESTLLRLRCAQCGFKCRRVHDRRANRVRDLEVSGRRMALVWQRRRMVCDNCACRFLEEHPAFEGALTARLSRRVVAGAKVMTFSAAARRHGVHWHAVAALVDTWPALVAERRRSRRCAVLLVDETSMRKRHRYVTVIVNGDTGRTPAMVEHRSSAALSAFLMQQGHRWCKGVKVVVSDGSKAYKSAIDAHLGHARHVLDRFHVIRWSAAGLTQVRRDAQRRPEGSKPALDPEVLRARFALLRRGDTPTDADRVRLDALFDAHPRLRAGWHALQELHGPYPADDYDGALNALGRFCDLYETGELPEYHDTVDTIIAWTDEILAWHHSDRASNSRIEGTNNPLQVHRRTAHGFTNPRNFEARGILATQSPQPVPATLQPTFPRRAVLFGGVVSGVGRALEPGVLFDSVDWNDLDALTQTLHDNAFLTHLSAVLYAFGLMFVITGLNSVRQYVTDKGLVGDMVRGGTLLGMLALFVVALIEGLDHMTVRVLDDGIGSNSQEIAVSVQSVKLGVVLIAWPVLYAAIGVAGLGGTRLLPAGLHRVVTGIASVVMLATAVLLLTAAELESNDFWIAVNFITSIVLVLWIIALSHAQYKGKVSPAAS